jgi:hypothetical protein
MHINNMRRSIAGKDSYKTVLMSVDFLLHTKYRVWLRLAMEENWMWRTYGMRHSMQHSKGQMATESSADVTGFLNASYSQDFRNRQFKYGNGRPPALNEQS